ncbi:MAG TPA: metallophosphoesterase [Saprospiraceae bacterium]|nr:metallophosphoesterase [Saprospiraceae bacterium]
MLNICLITDLHIDGIGYSFNGIDPRANFVKVLKEATSKSPELIVLAGDLCNKVGDLEIYYWIKQQMDALNIPYCCIPGNHDDASMMMDVFFEDVFMSRSELFFVKEFYGHSLIFLDTSQGSMSLEQYSWLNEIVSTIQKDVFIFMHHPPILAIAKHMEPRYAFQQMDEFQSICTSFQDKKFHIFTGHYHFERSIAKGNMTVYISPSTYLQIHPDYEEFKIQHDKIGYREIKLTDQSMVTNVNYL